ncbi:Carbamoyltransferase hypF2 [Candidatus Sulfopaludibacter sp. SbA6]|nr:Carbamoyltransferase hypF2 [Candidatus Sulfopaludibacter sp. SbA6]
MTCARSIRVRGVVQGVGFRPFVFRLAHANTLAGWVLNGEEGVEIHLEGAEPALDAFLRDLQAQPPPAARITALEVRFAEPAGFQDFSIRESHSRAQPSTRISPDLPVCDECLRELFDPLDLRYWYPYINCTNCGPRYTITQALPYDRHNTTMSNWPLDEACARQYHDPGDRRFHAQPVSCPACGPHYFLMCAEEIAVADEPSIAATADLLRCGKIVAVKGLGGYHLVCDAANHAAVLALRERKYRKEKPFAVMAKDLASARALTHLTADAEALMTSSARPIVLAPARIALPGVAPDNDELGVMLPYAPLHHLLFAAGAPEVLVMTSANRSSEPIAYTDDDARERLSEIADAFLIGERAIARRVDDSVARAGAFGPVILRRSRGYAPGAVARFAADRPILAVGADLKNTITLVAGGQAFVSQHIGDLDHYQAFEAFRETIRDLLSMYQVRPEDLLIVRDDHPQYVSTVHAFELPAAERRSVQHHRAHIASVLAEREAWDEPVLGVSFDGTGYGDDGAIWGGEIFAGSIARGFERIAHLRYAPLPGGDAAAQHPVQAAAGFLLDIEGLPSLAAPPFLFPQRYEVARQLARTGVRTFLTSSMGRLFDTAAALLGFQGPISFEGQAAMWLEHIARTAPQRDAYPFPLAGAELDFRPLLLAVAEDRLRGRDPGEIARAFQLGIAQGLCGALETLSRQAGIDSVVLSGGVFQNEMLLQDIQSVVADGRLRVSTNRAVPPNDGGISLGQAAMAAMGATDR